MTKCKCIEYLILTSTLFASAYVHIISLYQLICMRIEQLCQIEMFSPEKQ